MGHGAVGRSRPTTRFDELAGAIGTGGIIIDGGNTNYKDGLRLYADCKAKGVSLIDAGTSGGVWGLKEGYCLMVGGDDDASEALRADLHDARAAEGIRARRTGRRGTLLEDGAQRHRVRPASGVR